MGNNFVHFSEDGTKKNLNQTVKTEKTTKGLRNQKQFRANKIIILGNTWSGNSDNQLSLNLSPNIRILFEFRNQNKTIFHLYWIP